MIEPSIKRVCVVGAGRMGCGIAAHLRNVGCEVSLLDLTQEDVVTRFEEAKVVRPPLFYVPERAAEVRLGNLDDHFRWISEANWVIEAVWERFEVKSKLLTQIAAAVQPGTLLSTASTTVPIETLSRAIPEALRGQFMGIHFLYPLRYQHLVEIAPSSATDRAYADKVRVLLEDRLGKRAMIVRDTPGFIATRVGLLSLLQNIRTATTLEMPIELVDEISGVFLGRPASGTFRRADQLGLNYVIESSDGIRERRPKELECWKLPNSLLELSKRGWTGDAVGQGYYRHEGKNFLAFDLASHEYRAGQLAELAPVFDLFGLPLPVRVGKALQLAGPIGEFLRTSLLPSLRQIYAIREEIAESPQWVDQAVRWGQGWSMGPFEMIDAIGADVVGIPTGSFSITRPAEEEKYRPIRSYHLVREHGSLRIRDLGDGVSAISLTQKLGILSPTVVKELHEVVDDLDRFVITSEAEAFSTGYDLRWFLRQITDAKLAEIEEAMAQFQVLGEKIEQKRAVAAVFGYCLGGGLELALACPKIVAAAECKIGFPESRVGLIPAGRGTTLMRIANQHNAKRLCESAMALIEGTVAPNAESARSEGFLRPTDVTCHHPDRLLFDAKQAIVNWTATPRPEWKPVEGPLPGMIERAITEAHRTNRLSEYDLTISAAIRAIFAKTDQYAEGLLKERTSFIDLCGRALTRARLQHMIEKKKPLRN